MAAETDNSQMEAILAFWFGDTRTQPDLFRSRLAVWFGKDPAFDQAIADRFRGVYDRAAAGELAAWRATPAGCVALILLLDQFPRNLFRGSAQAFATDAQALAVAQHVLDQGFEPRLSPVERLFVYLPFEHSEDLAQQRRSVALFRQLAADLGHPDLLNYAVRHEVIIERFGRFPHRNAALGRWTSPEEAEFLTQPDSAF